MSSRSAATDPSEVFRQSWNVYEKFVRHNWMRHREVYGVLRESCRRWFTEPFAVADFGSGDGRSTLDALTGLPLRRYVAIDRVPALLDSVGAGGAGRECEVETIESDLLSAVMHPPERPVDLLLAAYSLHHLSQDEKETFLRQVCRWLRPKGRIVIVDLLRRPKESRRRYLDRFFAQGARRFGAFTPQERPLVREHMEACDFPETLPGLQAICSRAGLAAPRLMYRDPEEFYGVLASRPG